MKSETEWASRRSRLCLKAGVTNLNAGTNSPTSRAVLDKLTGLQAIQAEDPVQFGFRSSPVLVEAARRELAAFLRCEAKGLVLVTNATYAANTLARGLAFQPGDEILGTDQEYHHYVTMWKRLARETGIVWRTVPMPTKDEAPALTPDDIVKAFQAAMTPKTKALFFSHVTSATGLRLPVKALAALARERGALSLIDGAHAPGLVPVDLGDIGADAYFANIHKWMMGATSAAFLFVKESLRPHLPPLITTGGYAAAFDEETGRSKGGDEPRTPGDPLATSHWLHAHEYQGTRALMPIIVIPEVLRYLREMPLAEVEQRSTALANYCRARLSAPPLGFVPASHDHPDLRTAMVAFKVPKAGRFNRDAAGIYLRQEEQFEIGFPALADGTPLVRVSNAWFNSTKDIDALATALARMPWEKVR